MAIDFKCLQCGKALSAQPQYAGRRTTCPNCQLKMFIPLDVNLPPTPAAPLPAKVDEKQEITPDDAPGAQAGLRACPYCAEKIQAAARKCRYCNEYLDDELRRAEQERKRGYAVAAYRDALDRNARMWRALSILATSLTYTWLGFESINFVFELFGAVHAKGFPWVLLIFDVLLALGLMRLARTMRAGPPSVFVVAAIAILFCGPLNVVLNADFYLQTTSVTKDPQDTYAWAFAGRTMIGALLSLPVWYTALKLKVLSRAANRAKKP